MKAKAIISFPANTSHSLNSTRNFSSIKFTFPVINACALIKFQSSNLGFKLAISGACKNASLFNGLNNPDVFKFFSTTLEISEPIFSFLRIFSKLFFEFSSIDNGDTAIGSGFKLPIKFMRD